MGRPFCEPKIRVRLSRFARFAECSSLSKIREKVGGAGLSLYRIKIIRVKSEKECRITANEYRVFFLMWRIWVLQFLTFRNSRWGPGYVRSTKNILIDEQRWWRTWYGIKILYKRSDIYILEHSLRNRWLKSKRFKIVRNKGKQVCRFFARTCTVLYLVTFKWYQFWTEICYSVCALFLCVFPWI